MNTTLKIVALLLLAAAVIGGGWAAITLSYTYSSGERAGYIQKISQRGWLCKTWEGELAMSVIPGSMPQIFEFTVRDDAVAHQIEALSGQRVSLKYEEHPGVPTSCFGDTAYYIVGVTKVPEPGQMRPDSAPEAPAVPAAPATLPPPATPPGG